MKLGTITKNMKHRSLDEILALTSGIGYESVEISARPREKHVDVDQILSDDGNDLREHMSGTGMIISAFTCHLNLMDAEKGEQFRGHFDKTLKAAASMEVPVVTAVPGMPVGVNERDAFDIFKEVWKPRIELAEELEISVAMETFPNHIAYNVPSIRRMFEVLPSERLGLNFDPSHAVWQGIDNYKIIGEFSDKIFHAHAKDTEILKDILLKRGVRGRGWWRFRIPGWGLIDWRRMITALKESGYDYVLSFEHEDKTFGDMEGTEKTYEYLAELV